MSRPELIAPPEIVGWLQTLHISTTDLIPCRAVLWRRRIQEIHKQVSCVVDITSRFSSNKALSSTRIQQIQADMTYRALELLSMPPGQPAFLLDIGCGSGLSGEILDDEGYIWAGVDIAPSMLGEFYYYSGSVEGGTTILKSDLLKRLLWNEKSKEISSFKILGRASGSVLVASTVR